MLVRSRGSCRGNEAAPRLIRCAALAATIAATFAWHGAANAASAPRQEASRPPTHCAAATAKHHRLAGCVIQTGIASWYGEAHHGLPTANGEIYNMHMLTAAHATLPMNTLVRVICLLTGRSVVVRINDRLPPDSGRIIDLSAKAAALLGIKRRGLAKVRLVLVERRAA